MKIVASTHVFGYTARHDKNDPVAVALLDLVHDHPDRFAMRFSNAPYPFEALSTVSIERPFQKPADAVICPNQTNRTESCSMCALYWSTIKKRVDLRRTASGLCATRHGSLTTIRNSMRRGVYVERRGGRLSRSKC